MSQTHYVLGHDERERRRLALQASILNPFTEQLLRRAGVSSGMRVLDLGCGVGEVSMIAARLVGRYGKVVGIDIDEGALDVARQNSQQNGLSNVEYARSDCQSYRPTKLFDAVTGRFILVHTPNPLSLVQTSHSLLKPGGVAIFQDLDFSVIHTAFPESPLREAVFAMYRDFFHKAGLPKNAGTQIFHLFIEAGFSFPDCRAEYPIDGGADSPFYEWTAETLRSMLPRIKALGLSCDSIGDIDTLAQRLREEAVSRRSCCPTSVIVGGFARR